MPEAHAAFFSGPSLRKVNRHPADQYFKQRELPNFQVHGANFLGHCSGDQQCPRQEDVCGRGTLLVTSHLLVRPGAAPPPSSFAHRGCKSGGACHINWKACEGWLLAASVVFLKAPFCGAELGVHMACSCSGWALAAACEHTCFVEALDLPNKPATRCLESLPAKKKPGKTLHARKTRKLFNI